MLRFLCSGGTDVEKLAEQQTAGAKASTEASKAKEAERKRDEYARRKAAAMPAPAACGEASESDDAAINVNGYGPDGVNAAAVAGADVVEEAQATGERMNLDARPGACASEAGCSHDPLPSPLEARAAEEATARRQAAQAAASAAAEEASAAEEQASDAAAQLELAAAAVLLREGPAPAAKGTEMGWTTRSVRPLKRACYVDSCAFTLRANVAVPKKGSAASRAQQFESKPVATVFTSDAATPELREAAAERKLDMLIWALLKPHMADHVVVKRKRATPSGGDAHPRTSARGHQRAEAHPVPPRSRKGMPGPGRPPTEINWGPTCATNCMGKGQQYSSVQEAYMASLRRGAPPRPMPQIWGRPSGGRSQAAGASSSRRHPSRREGHPSAF
jgi:hypothetical protein